MVSGILVLFALQILGLSERGYGIFLTSAGVGGILGAATASLWVSRIGRTGTLIAAAVIAPAASIPMAFTRDPWTAGALFAVSAAAITVWNVASMSLRQALIPERLFGRVLGVYRMVIWGGIPVGALAGGLLARATSLPTVLVVSGLAELATAGVMAMLLRRHRDEIQQAWKPPATAEN